MIKISSQCTRVYGFDAVFMMLVMQRKVQFSSVTQSCLTLCDPMDCSTSGFPVHHQFPEPTNLMSIMLVIPSNHLTLSFPLLLPPSLLPRNRVFSNELVLCNRWPKIWSFSFSISPSNEYSGLISSGMDWFKFPEVQRTLKNLFQHHSSKGSILQCSAIFIVQLSHLCMTTWKNHSFN